MMSFTMALTAILVLAATLVAVSALAGVLWFRVQAISQSEADRPAQRLKPDRKARTRFTHPIVPSPKSLFAPRRTQVESDFAPADGLEVLSVQRAERCAPADSAGLRLISVPDLSTSTATAATDLADRFSGIWELADSGATTEAISQATRLPIGHIELILGLRRQIAQRGAKSLGQYR
jgi:hypothetical protein